MRHAQTRFKRFRRPGPTHVNCTRVRTGLALKDVVHPLQALSRDGLDDRAMHVLTAAALHSALCKVGMRALTANICGVSRTKRMACAVNLRGNAARVSASAGDRLIDADRDRGRTHFWM
jgi:hypothetical protein